MSWVTALLLATLTIAAYLAYVWVPVYVLHYEVKVVVRDYANQAVKNPNDAVLVEQMAHKIRSLQDEIVIQPDGREGRGPVVDLAAEDITWERGDDSTAPSLHVAFSYVRIVHYPILNRDVAKTMELDMIADISRADWGPAR